MFNLLFVIKVWGGDEGGLLIVIFIYCRFGLVVILIDFFWVLIFLIDKGVISILLDFMFWLFWEWWFFLLKFFSWGEFFWKLGEGGIRKKSKIIIDLKF